MSLGAMHLIRTLIAKLSSANKICVRDVSEFPLQALELANGPPELLARAGVFARLVIGVAAERQRARAIAEPLDVERRDLLLEAAGTEQHVCRRHAAIVEVQLRPFLA